MSENHGSVPGFHEKPVCTSVVPPRSTPQKSASGELEVFAWKVALVSGTGGLRFSASTRLGRSYASWQGMRRFVDRCRLSEARVASDLRRQFAKEAGDRRPGTSREVSIAGFRGVLKSGLGVLDLADNLVLFGIEFRHRGVQAAWSSTREQGLLSRKARQTMRRRAWQIMPP